MATKIAQTLSSAGCLAGSPIAAKEQRQGPAFAAKAPRTNASRTAVSCSLDASRASPILQPFHEKRAFKVIAGLHNFDEELVKNVVSAAQAGGATLVDIACDADLVRLALSTSKIPVCVSAVDPEAFLPAVAAGAHMVEIGNFDSFYESGRTFSAHEVLELTQRTRALLPNVLLSVTVPHTLPLPQQVELAEALQASGADLIQTEGGSGAAPSSAGVLGLVEKAAPTLAAAYSISRAVDIPVMCASGLSAVTVPLAFAAGASGVGVGSAVNKLESAVAMVAAVRAIADALPGHAQEKKAADTEAFARD